MTIVDADALAAGLEEILRAPTDEGTVELVVRRPAVGERELLEEAELEPGRGLVGDRWRASGGHPDAELTLTSARVIARLAGTRERWALAGDQLYVDLDLSVENLPAGTRLAVGSAVVEVSEAPHTGCGKFTARFGSDAIRFVNGKEHRHLRLRGVNCRVVAGGRVRPGDAIRKR